MKLSELEHPFWIDRDRAGASMDAIERLERDMGHALPHELVQALLLRDGGVSAYSSFQHGDVYVPLPAFFAVEELRQAWEQRDELGTPAGVVAIAAGGHEWMGLDYREGPDPKVVFQEDEDSPLELVAESFEALLDGLAED